MDATAVGVAEVAVALKACADLGGTGSVIGATGGEAGLNFRQRLGIHGVFAGGGQFCIQPSTFGTAAGVRQQALEVGESGYPRTAR